MELLLSIICPSPSSLNIYENFDDRASKLTSIEAIRIRDKTKQDWSLSLKKDVSKIW